MQMLQVFLFFSCVAKHGLPSTLARMFILEPRVYKTMEEDRLKRYKEKLEHMELRKKEFEEWSRGILDNDKDKLSSYKAFQEIAEAANDVIAMMLKDSDLLPEENYANIEKAVKHGLLPASLRAPLQEITGLRNRMVHEYNGLNDKTAKESAVSLIPRIEDFRNVVREWLRRK